MATCPRHLKLGRPEMARFRTQTTLPAASGMATGRVDTRRRPPYQDETIDDSPRDDGADSAVVRQQRPGRAEPLRGVARPRMPSHPSLVSTRVVRRRDMCHEREASVAESAARRAVTHGDLAEWLFDEATRVMPVVSAGLMPKGRRQVCCVPCHLAHNRTIWTSGTVLLGGGPLRAESASKAGQRRRTVASCPHSLEQMALIAARDGGSASDVLSFRSSGRRTLEWTVSSIGLFHRSTRTCRTCCRCGALMAGDFSEE
jgi:hypothetical protein